MILENHLKKFGSPLKPRSRPSERRQSPTDVSRGLTVCNPSLNLDSTLRLGFITGRLYTSCITGACRALGPEGRTDTCGSVTRPPRYRDYTPRGVVRTVERVKRCVPYSRRAKTGHTGVVPRNDVRPPLQGEQGCGVAWRTRSAVTTARLSRGIVSGQFGTQPPANPPPRMFRLGVDLRLHAGRFSSVSSTPAGRTAGRCQYPWSSPLPSTSTCRPAVRRTARFAHTGRSGDPS